MLLRNEKTEGDWIYMDEKVCNPDMWITLLDQKSKNCSLGIGKCINRQFWAFKCLRDEICHPLEKHKEFFSLVACTMQAMYIHHGPQFHVEY